MDFVQVLCHFIKGLEHPWIWVFTGGPGIQSPVDTKGVLIV